MLSLKINYKDNKLSKLFLTQSSIEFLSQPIEGEIEIDEDKMIIHCEVEPILFGMLHMCKKFNIVYEGGNFIASGVDGRIFINNKEVIPHYISKKGTMIQL